MYTEKEAAEKWCPMSRVEFLDDDHEGAVVASSRNRSATFPDLPLGTRCIASRCMAWRVGERRTKVVDHNDAPSETIVTEKGYCGLAGRQK